jgi:hypothetical protein
LNLVLNELCGCIYGLGITADDNDHCSNPLRGQQRP